MAGRLGPLNRSLFVKNICFLLLLFILIPLASAEEEKSVKLDVNEAARQSSNPLGGDFWILMRSGVSNALAPDGESAIMKAKAIFTLIEYP